MPYEWVTGRNEYRDTLTGQFVSQSTLNDMSRQIVAQDQAAMDTLFARFNAGQIDAGTLDIEGRELIKRSYLRQGLLAHGGRNNATPQLYGQIGYMLSPINPDGQYAYWNNFMAQVRTDPRVASGVRGGMYISSGRQSYNKAATLVRGIPSLSNYPGDGRTKCRVNCKCSLRFKQVPGGWDIYWVLGIAEHCEDCVALASSWNPLRYRNGVLADAVAIKRQLEHVHTHHHRQLDAIAHLLQYGTPPEWATIEYMQSA